MVSQKTWSPEMLSALSEVLSRRGACVEFYLMPDRRPDSYGMSVRGVDGVTVSALLKTLYNAETEQSPDVRTELEKRFGNLDLDQ